VFVLSRNQQRLLAVYQMNPSADYNIPVVHRFVCTPVDMLSRAVEALFGRHTTLRLVFDLMNVTQSVSTRTVEVVQSDSFSSSLVQEMLEQPLDLTRECARVAVAQDGNSAVLVLVVHHIVCDGISLVSLLRELHALLAGTSPLPPVALQFVDYAVAEHRWLGQDTIAKWVKQ
jgi:NRPS condensation-like uncharacterized protein